MASELLEVHRWDAEGCPSRNLQFKTTQLFFEVVHDVEGDRTRAALGHETAPCILRFVQAQKSVKRWKTSLLTDLFASEFLFEKFRRALDIRAAQGKSIRDEWNSGGLHQIGQL